MQASELLRHEGAAGDCIPIRVPRVAVAPSAAVYRDGRCPSLDNGFDHPLDVKPTPRLPRQLFYKIPRARHAPPVSVRAHGTRRLCLRARAWHAVAAACAQLDRDGEIGDPCYNTRYELSEASRVLQQGSAHSLTRHVRRGAPAVQVEEVAAALECEPPRKHALAYARRGDLQAKAVLIRGSVQARALTATLIAIEQQLVGHGHFGEGHAAPKVGAQAAEREFGARERRQDECAVKASEHF